MELGLAGKRAIVTGGSRGIGLAICRALAAEGCALGLVARGEARLAEVAGELRAAGTTVATAVADVTDGPAHDAAIEALAKALGGIDVVVANAGGSAPGSAFDAGADVFLQQWQLNFLAATRLLRAAAPHFARAGGGSCVIISSISGLEAFGSPAYVSAKAALHGYAKTAAKEGGPRNVRVNCVAPGSILFPGGSWDRRLKANPELYERWIAEDLPFKRLGTPEEIASMVAFVASPRASWVSGAVLVVDGAQSYGF